jgi:hypothetical protein
MIKYLLADGCSHTAGAEIEGPLIWESTTNSQMRWPTVLANKLGLTCRERCTDSSRGDRSERQLSADGRSAAFRRLLGRSNVPVRFENRVGRRQEFRFGQFPQSEQAILRKPGRRHEDIRVEEDPEVSINSIRPPSGEQPGVQPQPRTEGVSAAASHRGRPGVIRRRFWNAVGLAS